MRGSVYFRLSFFSENVYKIPPFCNKAKHENYHLLVEKVCLAKALADPCRIKEILLDGPCRLYGPWRLYCPCRSVYMAHAVLILSICFVLFGIRWQYQTKK